MVKGNHNFDDQSMYLNVLEHKLETMLVSLHSFIEKESN